MTTYQVIVGNIGTVYKGTKVNHANSVFELYVHLSKQSVGRAAGEDVWILVTGEGVIEREYTGYIRQEFDIEARFRREDELSAHE
jgi:hypothetical protein